MLDHEKNPTSANYLPYILIGFTMHTVLHIVFTKINYLYLVCVTVM